jgi:hypothetical protein
VNTFARIIPISKYDKVAYYSVVIDDDDEDIHENDESLFHDFIETNGEKYPEKMNHILNWIKTIGNSRHGAYKDYFRNEAETADASALPPKGIKRKPQYTESGEVMSNSLRLYCLRANEKVVFLFNGSLKTEKYAQDCPNVRKHFKLANILAKAIDKSIIDKDIVWNDDCTDIIYDDNLLILL